MNVTDSTPATFEQYLARWVDHGLTVEGRLDQIREMYDQEQTARDSLPSVIPPCPSWCRKGDGHPYEATDWDFVTHLRFHSSVPDEVECGARVEATERNKGGAVEVAAPTIGVYVEEDQTAEQARAYAAELLAAADVLDEIAGAVRSCPRSTVHGPHAWASLVPGQDWSCPGLDEVTR
jgi:hypothetical protein